jgi:hypothetical protein
LDSSLSVAAVVCLAALFVGHLAGALLNIKRIERWLPTPALASLFAVVWLLTLLLLPEDGKAFIYFQF